MPQVTLSFAGWLWRAAQSTVLAFFFVFPSHAAVRSEAVQRPQVAVLVVGVLPGFDSDEAPRFIADKMNKAGFSGELRPSLQFDQPPRDRVEWHFTSEPYAGGGVRQFIPIPSLQRLFGARRMLSVEAVLITDGTVRARSSAQGAVIGGADDKDLAALVTQVTRNVIDQLASRDAPEGSGDTSVPASTQPQR